MVRLLVFRSWSFEYYNHSVIFWVWLVTLIPLNGILKHPKSTVATVLLNTLPSRRAQACMSANDTAMLYSSTHNSAPNLFSPNFTQTGPGFLTVEKKKHHKLQLSCMRSLLVEMVYTELRKNNLLSKLMRLLHRWLKRPNLEHQTPGKSHTVVVKGTFGDPGKSSVQSNYQEWELIPPKRINHNAPDF